MTGVTYEVTEELYNFDGQSRVSYGIIAYSYAEDNSVSTITSIHDITPNKKAIEKLVDDCNRLDLSVIHLCDVVEDFLVG